MDRSRSKRSYYYDQDSDSQTPPPRPSTKPRYGGGPDHRRRSLDRRQSSSSSSKFLVQNNEPPPPSPASAATTSYRILCPDVKAGSVIGKSGSIIKALRQETGAWINVHQLVPGDEERIIETADNRRREPDGRPPQYSPAQEALLMIHERVVDCEFEFGGGSEEDEYGGGGWGVERAGRVTTRLVVPRMHVGCLMGKGGKIIEQMRIETKTHIRILPRDQSMPRCVSLSEEIVQVVGDPSNVKKAVSIISSRLKESMHRDRGPFRGRLQQSPDRFMAQDDEYGQYTNNVQQYLDGPDPGPRSSGGFQRSWNNYTPRSTGHAFDADANHTADQAQSVPFEDIVFRILCPNEKVERIFGDTDGLLQMLQEEVGVDIIVSDPVHGSDERVLIISSDEGPDDELFPAQEALLHIQTHIADLGPDKDNIVTTRLLVPASEITCLEGRESRDGSLSEIRRLTSTDIQILPRDRFPPCALEADELVQIVGEIRAARVALMEITTRLRSYLYHDSAAPKDLVSAPVSVVNCAGGAFGTDSSSPDKVSTREGFQGSDNLNPIPQNTTSVRQMKDLGGCGNGPSEREENNNAVEESTQGELNSSNATVITKATLEVVVPEHAVRSLSMKSGSKLVRISDMSGATVKFVEDRPELAQKVIQISGSPEQAEKAQSLLQGLILSTLDDMD